MKTSYRKDYCAKFNETFEGETITISGWCSSIRDHGGVIFIDLRDKSGIIQIVSDPNNSNSILSGAIVAQLITMNGCFALVDSL